MSVTDFGQTSDGELVQKIRISCDGLVADILTWGAVVQNLKLKGHPDPLVLGFENMDDYLKSSPHFGAIVGRCANRIKNGQFRIDGDRYQSDLNENERHCLHGGSMGIGRQLWTLAEHGDDFVTLTLRDFDTSMGFPGNLDIRCTYRVLRPGRLIVELSATCDEPTLCNLAHHSYFNLDNGGTSDCLEHRMVINAGAYLPVDDEKIPTGVVQPVDKTVFEFRTPRRIRREDENGKQVAYDHNFCLSAERGTLKHAVWMQGGSSGVDLEVWTTEPGLQLYAGDGLNIQAPGLDGRIYGPYAGVALEPQIWAGSPNHTYFPQAELRPGEEYVQRTEYRLRLV